MNDNTETTAIEMCADTMLGDLMSCIVDELRHSERHWSELSEDDQRQVIYRIESRVRANVKQAVEIIASADRPTIVATVEQVTVKDGIKAVLTLPKSDGQRHELFDAAGRSVLLIVGGASEYMGGADQVQPDPDQRSLIDEEQQEAA